MFDDHSSLQHRGFRHADGRKFTESEKQTLKNQIGIGGAVFIVAAPILFGLTLMPFWDQIGDWTIIAYINDILAPAIGKLPVVHQKAASLRRVLIGASVILNVLFLLPFIVILFSKRRRFFYLESYDLTRNKTRFYVVLLLFWMIFAVFWYLVFVNETWIVHNAAVGRLAIVFPLMSLFLGQMTVFALLGIVRDLTHLPGLGRRLIRRWRDRRA